MNDYDITFSDLMTYRNKLIFQLMHKSSDKNNNYYIWRSNNDNKVRQSHLDNNGKIFSYNNPPSTGHPGDDYGCRCWAEPIVWRYATQNIITKFDNNKEKKWDYKEFIFHAYFGNGQTVNLIQIGHLADIIYHVEHNLDIYDKINQQIMDYARRVNKIGFINYDTIRTYDFTPVHYAHGNSTLKSDFKGHIKRDGNYLVISGIITYDFHDIFTDPIRIREIVLSNSNPDEVPEWILHLTDIYTTIFKIIGSWQTKFQGVIINLNHENN